MSRSSLLPAGFEALEPFTEFWVDDTAAKRAYCRDISNEASRQAFYNTAVTLVPLALEHLDAKSLADLSDSEQRLMQLVLSFGHVAMAVELQGSEEAEHAQWRPFMQITTTPADR
jgi:hypothetical protein